MQTESPFAFTMFLKTTRFHKLLNSSLSLFVSLIGLGMLSGSCVNTGSNSSYFILCSSDSIDIYRYSDKDCLSVYKTRTLAKGCQEGIEANFDDWLIDNGVGVLTVTAI